MANSIALFQKYIALLDEVYKQSALSSDLDGDSTLVRAGANTNEIIIPKMELDGLADYSRNGGYVKGNVSITYETVKFNYDRGRKFDVDKANTAKANTTITLDEGLETFNLVFKEREEAVPISFNPNDTDIMIRIKKSQENIANALKEIPEGEGEDAETLQKINEVIYNEIDYVFGNKISDKVFKHCSPIATNDKGETFVERFLNAVAPHIRSRIEAAQKASEARIAKHTAKYEK